MTFYISYSSILLTTHANQYPHIILGISFSPLVTLQGIIYLTFSPLRYCLLILLFSSTCTCTWISLTFCSLDLRILFTSLQISFYLSNFQIIPNLCFTLLFQPRTTFTSLPLVLLRLPQPPLSALCVRDVRLFVPNQLFHFIIPLFTAFSFPHITYPPHISLPLSHYLK